MTYRLDGCRPLALEIRQVSKDQFDLALACLDQVGTDNAEQAVHEFRKTTKKLRALLRVAADALPREDRARWASNLRQAALALSPQREAVALGGLLERAYDSVVPWLAPAARRNEMTQSLLARLPKESDTSVDLPDFSAMRATITKTSDELQQALGRDIETATLEHAITNSYRRGRKALKLWREQPSIERLHDFRKRVKIQLYQLRLLAGLSKKSIRRQALALEQLAELLGSCHDLAQLRNVIETARTTWSAPAEPAGLTDWIELQLDTSRRQARHLALRLYRASTKRWQRRLRRALKRSSKRSPSAGAEPKHARQWQQSPSQAPVENASTEGDARIHEALVALN